MKKLLVDNFGFGFNSNINDILVLSDGGFIVGGNFTQVPNAPTPSTSTSTSTRLAIFDSDSNLKTTFNHFNNRIRTISLLPNNGYLVTGDFSKAPSAPNPDGVAVDTSNLAVYNSDWILDHSFNNISGSMEVHSVLIEDNRYILGGTFDTVPSAPSPSVEDASSSRIVIYNSSWNIDASFSGFKGSGVNTIIRTSDGKYAVGGEFTSAAKGFYPTTGHSDVSSTNLVIYGSSPSPFANFDTCFNQINPGSSRVESIFETPDGKYAVGGQFENAPRQQTDGVTDVSSLRLVVYDSDWNIDLSFSHFDNVIETITSDSKGRYLIGGSFINAPRGFHPNTDISCEGAAIYDSTWQIEDTFNLNASGVGVAKFGILQNNNIALSGGFLEVDEGFCSNNPSQRTESRMLAIYNLFEGNFEPATTQTNDIKQVPIIEEHMCHGPMNENEANAFRKQNRGLTELAGNYKNQGVKYFFFPKKSGYCFKGGVPNTNFLDK